MQLEAYAMIAAKIVAWLLIHRKNGPVPHADSVWSERAHRCMVARPKQVAAHQKPRPSQTSGGPAPYAIEDPAPLQNERVRKRGMVILARIHLPDRKSPRQPSAGHWYQVRGPGACGFKRTEVYGIKADH